MNIKKNIPLLTSISLITLCNLFLINLPLAGVLGYEFSAINSFLLYFISGFFFISKDRESLKDKIFWLSITLFIVIPFLIILIVSLFRGFCSFFDGLLFYLIITVPSVIIGISISYLVTKLFNRFRRVLFVIVSLIIICIPIAEIYFNPQIYFFNPIIGYFPGNIYDEGLNPDFKLLLYRIFNIFFFGFPLISFVKLKSIINRNKFQILAYYLILPVAFLFISPSSGFSTTFNVLSNQLNKKLVTNDFVIHFNSLTDIDAKYAALSLEYYSQKFQEKLKIKYNEKVEVYIFDSMAQKQKLFGAGAADVAKPWQNSIYISKDSWIETIDHELLHIYAGKFGWSIFKIADSFNPALIEGFAMAMEGDRDNLDLDYLTSLANRNGYVIKPVNLFSGFNFFKINSSLGYITAGSFIKFLKSNYGIEKIKLLYSKNNFDEIFGKSINQLSEDYLNYISTLNYENNKASADYYFGRASIIQKVCPRYVSSRLSKAWLNLNEKKYDEALEIFSEIKEKSLNYSVLIGISEIEILTNKTLNSKNLIEKNLNKFQNSPYYYNLLLRLGDLYSIEQNNDSASICYTKIIDAAPQIDLNNLSKTRMMLFKSGKLEQYIKGNDSAKFVIVKELNTENYNYVSLPLLINLSQRVEIDEEHVINIFKKKIEISDIESAYAAFVLSEYFMQRSDFDRARRTAALALRKTESNPYSDSFRENFNKAKWLYNNYLKLDSTLIFDNSR